MHKGVPHKDKPVRHSEKDGKESVGGLRYLVYFGRGSWPVDRFGCAYFFGRVWLAQPHHKFRRVGAFRVVAN